MLVPLTLSYSRLQNMCDYSGNACINPGDPLHQSHLLMMLCHQMWHGDGLEFIIVFHWWTFEFQAKSRRFSVAVTVNTLRGLVSIISMVYQHICPVYFIFFFFWGLQVNVGWSQFSEQHWSWDFLVTNQVPFPDGREQLFGLVLCLFTAMALRALFLLLKQWTG